MAQDVYSRVAEKMKNEQFTEDEIRIVAKAKEQISSYTTGGSVIGGLSALALVRAKGMKGLQGIAITTGGFLIGSQLGLIMGALKSVRTIQSIPNFQRVMNIVQEVRDEGPGLGSPGAPRGSGAGAGGGRQDPRPAMPSISYQRTSSAHQVRGPELLSDDAVELQEQQLQEFNARDGYHGGHDPTKASHDQGSGNVLLYFFFLPRIGVNNNARAFARVVVSWAHAQQRAKDIQSHSTSWGQIRQQNAPKSAWNDIREGRRRTQLKDDQDLEGRDDELNQSSNNRSPRTTTTTTTTTTLTTTAAAATATERKTSAWDRVRQGEANGLLNQDAAPDGPSAFPRTREDLESRPSRQKNRYGDAL
ncbi:hypothetical protein BGX34_011750 [Mortierella sp. NVP85]|nr:hypothetical protein BGX34_011750 [Mortierella sp. NVP85]